MKFIFFLVFGLLFKTLSAMKVDKVKEKVNSKNISYRLDIRQFLTFLLKKQCPSNLEKVEKSYDGHVEVFESFGGPLHPFSETLLKTYRGHIDRLIYCSKSNSTIWSIGCDYIIGALSHLSELGKNPMYFLKQNDIASRILFSLYRKIVTKYSNNFGELVKPINDELKTLDNFFAVIFKQFLTSLAVRKRGHCEKINFKDIMKCGQRLINMIALIAEISLSDCGCATITNDTYEAIVILICILYDGIMAILAVIVTMAAEILSRTQIISDKLLSYLRILDDFINGIHKTMSSVPEDTAKDVRKLIETLCDVKANSNDEWEQLLGPSEDVPITDIQVKKNLLRFSNVHHRL